MVRYKNRYLVVEINPEHQRKDNSFPLTSPALHKAIISIVQLLHGDFGSASIKDGYLSKYFNEKTRIAIIRARHGPHKLISSALPFIKEVDGKRVSVITLYTGASMQHSFKFILNHQQKKVDEICATLASEEDKADIKNAFFKLPEMDF